MGRERLQLKEEEWLEVGRVVDTLSGLNAFAYAGFWDGFS
jgi:hypothetical protein